MARSNNVIAEIVDALRRIFAAFEGQPCSVCDGMDLTGRQIVALLLVGEHGPVTVSRLAGLMSLKVAAVSVMMNRLEEVELISRNHSSSDRRVVALSLTETGSHVVQLVSSKTRDFITAMELNDATLLEAVHYSLKHLVLILEGEIGKMNSGNADRIEPDRKKEELR
ncbi:MAG TPA: MarR family transcriptional regulator [Geobacteraceae bacterium]